MNKTAKCMAFALILVLFAVSVSAASMLEINDIIVKVNDDKQSADEAGGKINIVPESTVTFKIKVKNLFDSSATDAKIEDIEVTGLIEEVDDGDDLEETADEFDLTESRDKTITLTFKLPLRLGTDETYKMTLTAEGDDQNGTTHKDEVVYDVDVDKEKHEIRFISKEITPTKVSCSRNAQLAVRFINTGEEDEDVSLSIQAPDLQFSKTADFELVQDIDDDDNEYEFTSSLNLEGVAPGTYILPIRATYNGGRLKLESALAIDVASCGSTTTTTKPVVEEPVVVTPQPTQTQVQTQPTVDVVSQPSTSYVRPSTVVATPKTSYNQSWFAENKWLVIIIATDLILVIVGIIIIVSVMNRRK